jgi:Mg2+ and Co2+ transporter CorA
MIVDCAIYVDGRRSAPCSIGEIYEAPPRRHLLRDVQDRVLRVTERVEGIRELLTNILSVNLTLVGVNQNDQMK